MAGTVEQKQLRLEDLRLKRFRLQDAIASGVLEIDDEGRRLRYKTLADMKEALRMVESWIADLEGELGETVSAKKIKYARYSPAPGYRC